MKHSLLSGEGSNAKVFTPNWLTNNEIGKVGEGVKAKNEKWLMRAQCARMYASPPSESEKSGIEKGRERLDHRAIIL